jgi:hypothetical protein
MRRDVSGSVNTPTRTPAPSNTTGRLSASCGTGTGVTHTNRSESSVAHEQPQIEHRSNRSAAARAVDAPATDVSHQHCDALHVVWRFGNGNRSRHQTESRETRVCSVKNRIDEQMYAIERHRRCALPLPSNAKVPPAREDG